MRPQFGLKSRDLSGGGGIMAGHRVDAGRSGRDSRIGKAAREEKKAAGEEKKKAGEEKKKAASKPAAEQPQQALDQRARLGHFRKK